MIRQSKSLRIIRNKKPIKYIQLTAKSARELKLFLYQKQNKICPVLKRKLKLSEIVLDHKHKLKKQKPGPIGRGLVRGVIHFKVNSFEGSILKKYKRYGLSDEIELSDLLRNLADYLDNPPCEQKYIHPSERIRKILKKSQYNKIVKYYKIMFPKSKKIPEYPKSGIKRGGNGKIIYKAVLTQKWEKLFQKVAEIELNNKK